MFGFGKRSRHRRLRHHPQHRAARSGGPAAKARRLAPTTWQGLEALEPRLLLSATTGTGLEALPAPAPLHEPATEAPADLGAAPHAEIASLPPVNPLPGGADAAEPAGAPPFPLADTFQLHSNAGADHVIYLDFNGHTTSGTAWNDAYNGGDSFTTPAYDFASDGDPSFNNAEREEIQRIWQRTAEDYIPFEVDVTTEFPGESYLRKFTDVDPTWGVRVVIGGSSTQWYNGGGGVAYVGSFDNYTDTPAYVFTVDQARDEGFVAEAASHEAGHTLGLGHATEDEDGDGDKDDEYFDGYTTPGGFTWAPIMGNSYREGLTHWDEGEFNGALNTEDDLAIITRTEVNFDYRADDHSDYFGFSDPTPLSLSAGGTQVAGSGIISEQFDQDNFRFDHGGGQLDLSIDNYERGPNLDIDANFYRWDSGAGSWDYLFDDNPAGSLDATISGDYRAGTYMLRIDGAGLGNPATNGYSDYGSLGQYTISGTKTEFLDDLPLTRSIVEGFTWFRDDGVAADDNLSFNAYLNNDTDTDSYYFAGDSGWSGDYTIDVGDFGNTVDPIVGVYDADTNNLLYSDDDGGIGDDSQLTVPLTGAKRYVVAVRDRGLNTSGDLSINIDANDTGFRSTVALDQFGEGVSSGNLFSGGEDTDFYRFTAPDIANGDLDVTVSPTTSSLDVATYLYDAAGNELDGSYANGAGVSETLSTAGLTPGATYYASVLSTDYASSGNFDINVDFGTVLPETMSTAQAFAPFHFDGTSHDTQSLDAFISPGSDVDSYYFAGDSSWGGTYTIDVGDFNNAVDPVAAVYNASTGALVGLNNDAVGDDARLNVSLNGTTRYILAVADVGQDTTGDLSIDITAPDSTPPATVSLDSQGEASLSGLVINQNPDTDFYQFTAPSNADGSLSVTMAPTSSGLNAAAWLFDGAGNELDRSWVSGAGAAETVTYAGVTPGTTYYLSALSRDYASNGSFEVNVDFGTVTPATVAGRHVFYNDSAFDGNDAAANSSDDGAIATDKAALLPGQAADFASYTSYSRGLNGVMVDIAGADLANISANDFTFAVGNDDTPGDWATGPSPTSVNVREGDGVGGSDRVSLTWAEGAIANQWLEVTVESTAQTGLAAADVFYFGNWAGETGNDPSNAAVNAFDTGLTRDNSTGLFDAAAIDNRYDFNRDEAVNALDYAIARDNASGFFSRLSLIAPPSSAAGSNGSSLFANDEAEADPWRFDDTLVL